jgi:hypothetical protein
MTDGKLLWGWHPQANVSLHALARRIERGHERDHAALLRDRLRWPMPERKASGLIPVKDPGSAP